MAGKVTGSMVLKVLEFLVKAIRIIRGLGLADAIKSAEDKQEEVKKETVTCFKTDEKAPGHRKLVNILMENFYGDKLDLESIKKITETVGFLLTMMSFKKDYIVMQQTLADMVYRITNDNAESNWFTAEKIWNVVRINFSVEEIEELKNEAIMLFKERNKNIVDKEQNM